MGGLRWVKRILSSRRTGLIWSLTALAVLTSASCSASREDLLKIFDLDLPGCRTTNMWSAGNKDWPQQHMLLRFTAPKVCVEQYLDDHGVSRDNPLHWPTGESGTFGDQKVSPTDPPFQPQSMKDFKLKLDPEKRYDLYNDFKTPTGAVFLVLVDPQGEQSTIYLDSVSLGHD
ncbi:hypothetical protein N4G70_36815 [Streptomyces sp. ASQP_92]|uniref:hypothetical protein n=1 Tax=Streptomyces sp. ASQP_92 TaxID=2979116 RepID=UPI0021C06B05|nr:hypothetical protein [Streptomyces sp. ASQP_92]MCT9094355.1 hypothetical protein [Streptomyces sp. ASQP_92]